MGIRYAHTNLIARDWQALSGFYQRVFGCVPVPPQRNLRGDWLDRLTGLKNAHITGEHLALPGYEQKGPTLEIFSYDEMMQGDLPAIHRTGLAHLAFEVDAVAEALALVIAEGGAALGEVVSAAYPGGITAEFVYARDPEGNLIELQSWKRPG